MFTIIILLNTTQVPGIISPSQKFQDDAPDSAKLHTRIRNPDWKVTKALG